MSLAHRIQQGGIAERALAASGGSGLARYEAACRAISEAAAVDEVKSIRDTAMAMSAAARIANNRDAEAEMMAIRFRAERRLGELMAAQRDTTGLSNGGRPPITGFQHNPVSRSITLAEVGIDKNLADRARKYAAVPEQEFEARISEYRSRVEEEGARATADLLKAGEKAERRENDFYPTPHSLVHEIAARWRPRADTIWEPCRGDGRLVDALIDRGLSVVSSDITSGKDFFSQSAPPIAGAAICTNPPFDRLREFVDHAFSIGVQDMCLVLPERVWASGVGREQFERHRPSVWVNLDWREDYLGKGGSPDRALAVAIWDSPCAPQCRFDIWTRQAAVDQAKEIQEIGSRAETRNSHHVGRAESVQRQGAVAAQAPNQSDSDEIVAVKAKSRLADTVGVEPPLSAHRRADNGANIVTRHLNIAGVT